MSVYYCLVGTGFKPAPTRYGKHRLYWSLSKNQIVTKDFIFLLYIAVTSALIALR